MILPTYDKDKLLELLNKKKISFKLHNHPALFTVEDSEKNRGRINGMHSKNLFLKNKKNIFYLFSCHENQNIDLKKLAKSANLGNISFANKDRLFDILGVKPGSVSPFGLLNDSHSTVNFFLDKKIYDADLINFHPLLNTSTITLKVADLIAILLENNKKVNVFDFDTYSII